MIRPEPLTLEFNGIRLEPLALHHADGLRAAASDGELWNLRITSVPAPHETEEYIRTALETDNRLAFAVIDASTGTVIGTTSYHDIVPNIDRVEIGYTWYAKSRQLQAPPALARLRHARLLRSRAAYR
jgi:RimJ/RimL family protein N-acetyltransferase